MGVSVVCKAQGAAPFTRTPVGGGRCLAFEAHHCAYELRQKASEIARGLETKAARLREEYLEAQRHADELKARLDSADFAPAREFNFPGVRDSYRLCPRCQVIGFNHMGKFQTYL